MKIVRPTELYLESYKQALIQAISSGTAAYLAEAQRELSEIEADPDESLAMGLTTSILLLEYMT